LEDYGRRFRRRTPNGWREPRERRDARGGVIKPGERLVLCDSPFVKLSLPERWSSDEIFETKLYSPLVQRAAISIHAGDVVTLYTLRHRPLGVYITVTSGVCDVFFGPANPTVDQYDFRFVFNNNPGHFETARGTYQFYLKASANQSLVATAVFLDRF
jgi:hypothetical protein